MVFLKQFHKYYVYELLNESLSNSAFTNNIKLEIVTPTCKCKRNPEISNCRPISTLAILSQISEKNYY